MNWLKRLFARPKAKYIFERVIDGDTIAMIAPEWPKNIQRFSLRIAGIDCPETKHRAQSEIERQKGQEAKRFLADWVDQSQDVGIDFLGWDRNGGRVVGNVILDGQDVATVMIEKGLALPYKMGQKIDWKAHFEAIQEQEASKRKPGLFGKIKGLFFGKQ